MQRLARRPLLTVHEHDPACSYSHSHDDGDTIIINLLYIRYNIMIARTYYVNFRTRRDSNKETYRGFSLPEGLTATISSNVYVTPPVGVSSSFTVVTFSLSTTLDSNSTTNTMVDTVVPLAYVKDDSRDVIS